MNEAPDPRALLEEIRDLLIPISRVYRSQHGDLLRQEHIATIDRIIALVGKSSKRRAAVEVMDGSRGRKEILELSAIDAGELSRLIKKLRAENLVTEDGGTPKLVVDPAVIWKG